MLFVTTPIHPSIHLVSNSMFPLLLFFLGSKPSINDSSGSSKAHKAPELKLKTPEIKLKTPEVKLKTEEIKLTVSTEVLGKRKPNLWSRGTVQEVQTMGKNGLFCIFPIKRKGFGCVFFTKQAFLIHCGINWL